MVHQVESFFSRGRRGREGAGHGRRHEARRRRLDHMVVGGRVTNVPSDAAAERLVGDALLVLPRR
jgi:hypothetical protein